MKRRTGESRRRHALILAAGVGSRLRPLTDRLPKCLVPISGRPILAYWIDALTSVGVRDIWINTHAHAEQVRSYLASYNARDCGAQLHECHEPVLLGSAGTIAANRGIADGATDVLVLYADNFSLFGLRRVLDFHAERKAAFTMTLFETSRPSACGIVALDPRRRIVHFEEKPSLPRSNLANAGIYVLDAATYREIADLQAFDIGFDVIKHFVGRMYGYRLDDFFIDVGTPDAYGHACATAEELLATRGQTPDGLMRAVFIDGERTLLGRVRRRDSTHSLRLARGSGRALRALRDAGFAVAVHGSGPASDPIGSLAEAGVRERMFELLANEEVMVNAVYSDGASSALPKAARAIGLALERSYAIAASPDDVSAAAAAGCAAVVVVGNCANAGRPHSTQEPIRAFSSFSCAAEWILADAAPPTAATPRNRTT